MPGISRTEENRKLVFLLPSIAFNEQNVKVRLKNAKKGKTEKEKKTQWLAKIGSRLAARGSGSQARTLVNEVCIIHEHTKISSKTIYSNSCDFNTMEMIHLDTLSACRRLE